MKFYYRGWIFAVFCIIVRGKSIEQADSSLSAVFMVFRHGDRTPLITYPTDPHRDYDWPGGFGILSTAGIKDMYRLGSTLRKRYTNIVPENKLYSNKYMFARSSYRERCIMSGLSFLAAFMPPSKNKPILDIAWQPVPINPIPVDTDYLLAQDKPCPKYDSTLPDAFKINNSDPEINAITNQRPNEFLNYIFNHTGKKMTSLEVIVVLRDTLQVEMDNNLNLPKWTSTDNTYSTLEHLTDLANLRRGQSKLVQVYGGALLNDLLVNFESVQNGSARNIFINSAHDITLVSLLGVLDVVNQTAITQKYGAALSAELHRTPHVDNDFEIRFYYFKSCNATQPIRIDIPQCPEPCLLRHFRTIFETKLVDNFDEACN